MKAAKTVANVLGFFVVMPIWYYLVFQFLKRTDASELMWFLYWVYLPVGMLVGVLNKIVESNK